MIRQLVIIRDYKISLKHANFSKVSGMIHAASIASRETRTGAHLNESIHGINYSNLRLQYNSAQFRDRIVHSAIQTDLQRDCFDGVDADTQVNFLGEHIKLLQDELTNLYARLDSFTSRFAARERILISQMNAVRDQQLVEKSKMADEITACLTFKTLEIDNSGSSPALDSAEFSVGVVDSSSDVMLSMVKTDSSDFELIEKLEVRNLSAHLKLRRGIGPVYLSIVGFAFSNLDKSLRKIVLGEWASPPFLPCLKDLHKPETLLIVFQGFGTVEAELTFL